MINDPRILMPMMVNAAVQRALNLHLDKLAGGPQQKC